MSLRKRKWKKLIHEGPYVAEIEVELVDTEEGWSPYLSLDDALKLDEVREALRKKRLRDGLPIRSDLYINSISKS